MTRWETACPCTDQTHRTNLHKDS